MAVITRIIRTVTAASLLAALGGCGYLFGDQGVFRDTSEDYKKAPELPAIAVPEGKNTETLQEAYPIPEVQDSMLMAGEFEVPRPTPLVAGAADEIVRIQKLGDESWALVAESPGQVWPQVRSFLTSAGISVARIDARAGIIETGWMELQDQPIASRFRVRIEQGVQRGTSELHVLQMIQAGDVDNWPANSDDPEQESEMLQALAQYIANSAGTAPVSMVANQEIDAAGKITLKESSSGEAYIALELPYDRAWASLGRALTKSTFEITDRDRSNGIFYTRFLGPQSQEEDGWFDWLWDSEEEHPHAGEAFNVTVEKVNASSVTIHLRPQSPETALDLRDQQAMLSLIKGNIN
jgi:outer membrane protein assembly factor BamC